MADKLLVRLPPELKDVLIAEADAKHVYMGELAVRILAKGLGRNDLAYVPRAKMGRPRKAEAEANGNGHAKKLVGAK